MDTTNDRLFAEFPPVPTPEWEARIIEDLKGADYSKKLIWKTNEGFEVRPYYRAEDLAPLSHLGAGPGEYPFVRSIETGSNHWEVRQDMESSDPKEANFQAQDAVKKGASAIGFIAGNIKTVRHIETLIKGLCFGECSLHFGGAPSYPDLANLLVEYMRKHHVNKKVVRGSFDFDPISYLLLEGDFWKSEEFDLGQVAEMVQLGKESLPSFRVITVNGQYFNNAGASIVQELAFSLASGLEYLNIATEAGLSVDDISPKMVFSMSVGSNYFMEIAKLRAARMLWARIVEQFNPQSRDSMKMHIHSSTSNFNKTLYDPYVNILRTTTEAMSAVIGGTQSLSITPFDAFFKDPDDFSGRIARNQQIILKEEAYLENVLDPAAGSYYIEQLTDTIARSAWALFQEVESKGGMLAAVKEGFVQDSIEKQAKQTEQDIATRRTIVLGSNQYPNLQEMMLEKIQEGESIPEDEEEKPSSFKKLEIRRAIDAFEELRLATEIHTEGGGKRPSVFLFTIGNLAMRKARAMFTTNFFGCAGYSIIDNPGFASVEEGVKAALNSKAEIVVICSSDEEYAELAPAIASALKSRNNSILVILAGYPKEIVDSLKSAGVDDFIHIRTNVLEFLKQVQKQLNIFDPSSLQ